MFPKINFSPPVIRLFAKMSKTMKNMLLGGMKKNSFRRVLRPLPAGPRGPQKAACPGSLGSGDFKIVEAKIFRSWGCFGNTQILWNDFFTYRTRKLHPIPKHHEQSKRRTRIKNSIHFILRQLLHRAQQQREWRLGLRLGCRIMPVQFGQENHLLSQTSQARLGGPYHMRDTQLLLADRDVFAKLTGSWLFYLPSNRPPP